MSTLWTITHVNRGCNITSVKGLIGPIKSSLIIPILLLLLRLLILWRKLKWQALCFPYGPEF